VGIRCLPGNEFLIVHSPITVLHGLR
jgi:hypothetical protein